MTFDFSKGDVGPFCWFSTEKQEAERLPTETGRTKQRRKRRNEMEKEIEASANVHLPKTRMTLDDLRDYAETNELIQTLWNLKLKTAGMVLPGASRQYCGSVDTWILT